MIGKSGNEAMHHLTSCCFEDLGAAEQLLREQPALLEARSSLGETALHYLVVENHIGAVQLLLRMGADVATRNNYGDTPLHQAAQLGYVEMVQLLIARGASVAARDQNGDTPLHLAAASGRERVVLPLLQAGADIEARNPLDQTPLHMAVMGGHREVVSQLLACGADVHARGGFDQTPLLSLHGTDEDIALVELLVRYGARLDEKTDDGETLLHRAAYFGRLELVRYLIERGLDPRAKDDSGQSPYDEAMRGEQPQVAALLRTHMGSGPRQQ